MTAWQLWPGDVAAELARGGAVLSEGGMARLLSTRRAVIEEGYNGTAHGDIAVLLTSIVMSGRNGNAPADQVLARARGHAVAALRGSPADGAMWQVLAAIDLYGQQREAGAKALEMSYRADPHSGVMAVARVTNGLTVWDKLSPDTQERVRVELREAFRSNREYTIQVAMKTGRLDDLRASLSTDAAAARRLETILRSLEGEAG